jgi:hypothetical protein
MALTVCSLMSHKNAVYCPPLVLYGLISGDEFGVGICQERLGRLQVEEDGPRTKEGLDDTTMLLRNEPGISLR